jgi:hypothetical protein
MSRQTDRQLAWLRTAISVTAAQALAVPPDLVAEAVASRPKKPSSVPKRAVRKARLSGLVRRIAALATPAADR